MDKPNTNIAKIEKLIHGGQGLGTLADGRKALLWNALPGETVSFTLKKSKTSYLEGIAREIIKPSADRIEPRDELYLSTSPWQPLLETKEDQYKREILNETFIRGGIPGCMAIFQETENFWLYRNKMEYSFYGDDAGLHLALFNRGSHQKQIVSGSSIAMPVIDSTANELIKLLNEASVRASSLKSVIIRANQNLEVVVALFVKDEDFPKLDSMQEIAKGLVVVYSNPKSPASVRTRDLYTFGDINLSDSLCGKKIGYDVFSFFQVNISVFEKALQRIGEFCGQDTVVDFYSGVGSIGLSLPNVVALIESDPLNIAHAKENALRLGHEVEVVQAAGEHALDHIPNEGCLVVDPPRAGLHSSVIDRIIETRPPKIAYLSCNPSTQARDIAYLSECYEIESIEGYNFFPRTPHIESLAMLKLRK